MTLDAESVAASLPTMMTRMDKTDGGPQVWYTASAGKGPESEQLGRLRGQALTEIKAILGAAREADLPAYADLTAADPELAARLGQVPGYDTCFADWSILPHDDSCEYGCDRHDDPYTIQAACKANPGYGLPGRIDGEMIDRVRRNMDDATYLREILGVGHYPVAADGWAVIPRQWWEDTTDSAQINPARAVYAVDSSRFLPGDRTSTSIASASQLQPGITAVELADYRPGTKWAVGRVLDIDSKHGPATWIIDKRAAAGTFVTELEEAGVRLEIPTAGEVAHACGQFYDACQPPATLRHQADREVNAALAGLAKRKLGDGYAWDRQTVLVDISPLYALTLAHWGWLKFGQQADYDVADSVGWDVTEVIRLYKIGHYGPGDLIRLWDADLIDDKGLTAIAAAGIPIPAQLSERTR
jgi:hypothetical protein